MAYPAGIPADTDPNARTECPRCWALIRAVHAQDHADDHTKQDRWRAAVEVGLRVPAPEPGLIDWPARDTLEPEAVTAAMPAGPYAPDPEPGL